MKTTGRNEQILFAPKNDTITLADGVASAVLSTTQIEMIRVLTTSDDVKICVGSTPDTAKYFTMIANVPEYLIVDINEKVQVDGGSAELAY